MINNKVNEQLLARLRQFIENEMRSCSMDFGCVTPEYVYRMWGGKVAMEEIEEAMTECQKQLGI